MRSTVLNRDFQHPTDGWYQIEVLGNHPNRAAGVVQVIDRQAAESIVNRFNQDAANGALRHGHEMLIDHEHFSDQPDQETRAYGWLQELQARDDGIYGRIHWTSTGSAAVDGGDYRFFSTEYAPKDLQVLNADTPRRVRPLRLDGLTLTNMNNNRGQKPITNRNNYGPHKTKEAWEAVRDENLSHVQANKDAHAQADAQRQSDSESEAAELALPSLEKWCRAVKSVMESASRTGHQMMGIQTAWIYARRKFPEIYEAAFGDGDGLDQAGAADEVSNIANRVAKLSGKNFDFGFQFVRAELPGLFNRLNPPVPAHLRNRTVERTSRVNRVNAAKVFNRLVRAEMAINGLPENAAHNAVRNQHPGVYGLMAGTLDKCEAFAAEPRISKLMI